MWSRRVFQKCAPELCGLVGDPPNLFGGSHGRLASRLAFAARMVVQPSEPPDDWTSTKRRVDEINALPAAEADDAWAELEAERSVNPVDAPQRDVGR